MCHAVDCGHLQERIGSLFPANRRSRSVTRIDNRLVRQYQHLFLNTLDELSVVATLKVGSTDATLKQDVAGKQDVVLLIVQNNAPRRVSWNMQHFKRFRTQLDAVAFVQLDADARCGLAQFQAEHAALAGHALKPKGIACMSGSTNVPSFFHKTIAERMVQMQMRIDQIFHPQSIRFDECSKLLFLGCTVTTRVDDHGFLAVRVSHVRIFLKRTE